MFRDWEKQRGRGQGAGGEIINDKHQLPMPNAQCPMPNSLILLQAAELNLV